MANTTENAVPCYANIFTVTDIKEPWHGGYFQVDLIHQGTGTNAIIKAHQVNVRLENLVGMNLAAKEWWLNADELGIIYGGTAVFIDIDQNQPIVFQSLGNYADPIIKKILSIANYKEKESFIVYRLINIEPTGWRPANFGPLDLYLANEESGEIVVIHTDFTNISLNLYSHLGSRLLLIKGASSLDATIHFFLFDSYWGNYLTVLPDLGEAVDPLLQEPF